MASEESVFVIEHPTYGFVYATSATPNFTKRLYKASMYPDRSWAEARANSFREATRKLLVVREMKLLRP